MSAERKALDAKEPVRLAVMGAGRWGINVVRTLSKLDGVELSWVADPDPRARERAASVSPSSRVCESIERALRDVHAVVICTPANDHFEHASFVLASGRHALVEKPMATCSVEARRLGEHADASGLILMVGHQLLHHPLFVELERLVLADSIGPLAEIRTERTGIIDFESDPDVLWAFGPHDISMILALTGEQPSSLSCAGSIDPSQGALDRATVELRFASGLVARVELDGTSARQRRRLTVVGERGRAVFDDAEPGGRLTVIGDERVAIEPDVDRGFEPLARSCRHFTDCVRTGERPKTDGRHGQLVTELIERIASEARDGDHAA
ncbi:MAG: Gfo/Idh/MocA family oxidoreductase, partial [Deltaproteobacteria bacterium]|nr:Gfo/Idh/MocA family oxidoreductase [Deltaproteobacteria bacterium]